MGRLTRDPELRHTQTGTPPWPPSLWPWTGLQGQEHRRKDHRFHRHRRLAQHRGVRQQVLYQGPHGRGGGPAAAAGTGPTGTATSAALPRWWRTMSISATPAGRRRSRLRRISAVRSGGPRAVLHRPHGRLPAPPWATSSPSCPTTESFRSDIPMTAVIAYFDLTWS